jgi:hypothetical protein
MVGAARVNSKVIKIQISSQTCELAQYYRPEGRIDLKDAMALLDVGNDDAETFGVELHLISIIGWKRWA